MAAFYSVENTADVTVITTAETVVATLPGVSTSRPGGVVHFFTELTMTTGSGTNALTLRVRRDGLTGALVGEGNAEAVEASAGNTETHTLATNDMVAGEIAGQTYVLTVQATGASANGTVLHSTVGAQSMP